MALRANTFSSATRFTDTRSKIACSQGQFCDDVKFSIYYYRNGVTLKSRTLKRMLKRRNITQRQFARWLGMTKQRFCRKLYRRRKFGNSEMEILVRALGAKAAIKVIWFPSIEEKQRIQNYVWEGQMSYKYNPEMPSIFETPSQKKKRAIERQNAENYEDWEQSEDFEDYILNCDELPSRKFMRRRNNG